MANICPPPSWRPGFQLSYDTLRFLLSWPSDAFTDALGFLKAWSVTARTPSNVGSWAPLQTGGTRLSKGGTWGLALQQTSQAISFACSHVRTIEFDAAETKYEGSKFSHSPGNSSLNSSFLIIFLWVPVIWEDEKCLPESWLMEPKRVLSEAECGDGCRAAGRRPQRQAHPPAREAYVCHGERQPGMPPEEATRCGLGLLLAVWYWLCVCMSVCRGWSFKVLMK